MFLLFLLHRKLVLLAKCHGGYLLVQYLLQRDILRVMLRQHLFLRGHLLLLELRSLLPTVSLQLGCHALCRNCHHHHLCIECFSVSLLFRQELLLLGHHSLPRLFHKDVRLRFYLGLRLQE